MAHPGKAQANPDVFILPDLGEGVHEAELIKWRVKVGDSVREHDILADMETDKAVVEVPSPRPGVIAVLHGAEGEILNVGNPLVTYQSGAGGGAAKPAPAKEGAKAATPKASANGSAGGGSGGGGGQDGNVGGGEVREDAGTVVGAVGGALGGVTSEAGKALATPAVRRVARDLGVDIDRVVGTGIAGRVLEKDVRAAAGGGRTSAAVSSPTAAAGVGVGAGGGASARASAPAARVEVAAPAAAPAASAVGRQASRGVEAPSADEVTRVPFRGVRRTIANRLRESVNRAVHFTVMDEADASALDGVRRKLGAASGEKLSFLPFVASAVARVLGAEAFRSLNATVDERADGEGDAFIVQHRAVHLGIAADTDSGLMVPVVRDADRLGVLQLGRAISQVAEAARTRSATREQLMGSTFTISNVGSHAGRFATPIINYPEVGILAVGRAREGVVVHKGAFRAGLLLPLSLACDHRVVDGATAALALAEIVRLLQDPESLLAPARG